MDENYFENEFVLINVTSARIEMQYVSDDQCRDTLKLYKYENSDRKIRDFILNHLHLFPVVYGLGCPVELTNEISYYAKYYPLEAYFNTIFKVSEFEGLCQIFKSTDSNSHDLFRYYLIGKVRLLKNNIRNETEDDEDASYDFKKKIVCFTGGFQDYTRQDLFTIVYELGGFPTNQINRDTDFLVVADSFIQFKKESSKLILARALQRNGSQIKIISETQFINSIEN